MRANILVFGKFKEKGLARIALMNLGCVSCLFLKISRFKNYQGQLIYR